MPYHFVFTIETPSFPSKTGQTQPIVLFLATTKLRHREMLLSFFRSAIKKEASPLPQPAHHGTPKPSSLKITLASQPLRQGAVLSIKPRYWSFLSSSSRPAPIPPVPAASSKLALFFGKERQEEEDEEDDDEKTILKRTTRANAPVYLRFVLVGDHRALAKASSKAMLRLGRDGTSCVWPGKQAVQLVVPETATRFLSGDLSLVVEVFQQRVEIGKDVLLARGVVHHLFMEHLQKAEAPRVLVLPLVSTSPAIGRNSTITGSSSAKSKGAKKQEHQETRSEACIRLTYVPLVPSRQSRFADVEGEVIERQQQQQEEQQQQQQAPETRAVEDERVSSMGAHLHLDLAASLVEQIRQEQESKAPSLRMLGEEVVGTSEQEEEDKVMEVRKQGEMKVLKIDVLRPSLQAVVVGHGGRTAAAAAAAAAAGGCLPNKPAGTPLSTALEEGRRRHMCKAMASASRRRAQLARVNRLLADLETLPTTLKGGLDGRSKGRGRGEVWS